MSKKKPTANDLQVYAADVVTVGQYFFTKMLDAIGDQIKCKPEDRYKYTNPVMFVEYLRSLPLKPSDDNGAFQLSESGCAVLDAVVGHPSEGYDTDLCTYAVHQAWSRIQLKYKPSRFGKSPVLAQIILYELWESGHASFLNMMLGHGCSDPDNPKSPLRPIEAGEYCDLLRSVADNRMANIVQKGNFDGLFPQHCLGQDGKIDNQAIAYLMQVMNEGLDKLKKAATVQPELAQIVPAAEHYGMLIYRVIGIMRLDKVDKAVKNAIPVEALEKPPA